MEHYRFTPIADAARLYELAAFDASAYGEKDVPLNVLELWWNAFPAGVRIAQHSDGRIAGAMSGWPLTPAAYDTNAWYGGNSFEQPYLTAWGLK